MNKRQVIILWVIAIALGIAVAGVKLGRNQSAQSTTNRSQGQNIFESFPGNEATTIEIQGAASNVTLAKKDGKWCVTQRDYFPANNMFVNDFIRTLSELKVTVAMEAGPSFAPRFGMDETAKIPLDRGLTATFKDASGKQIAKLSLGKNIESGAEESPMGGGSAVGRYVRNHADESSFYAVSEMFPSVTSEPQRWLVTEFINPEKIKSITLSKVDQPDTEWKLTRETEEAEYKLEGGTNDEVLNTTLTAPLKNLFSYANFEDVVPASNVADRSATGKQTAIIETFEGFIYTLQITPSKPSTTPQAPENLLVSLTAAAAELPKERKKEKDEKPEDAKSQNRQFANARHRDGKEKTQPNNRYECLRRCKKCTRHHKILMV